MLRLLRVATHDRSKFGVPADLAAEARLAGLRAVEITGMRPVPAGWRMTRDMEVNYIAVFARA